MNYFYNTVTGATEWDKPAEMLQAEQSVVAEGSESAGTVANSTPPSTDWQEIWDDTNNMNYYYDTVTGVTEWEKPAEMLQAEQSAVAEASAVAPAETSKPAAEIPTTDW